MYVTSHFCHFRNFTARKSVRWPFVFVVPLKDNPLWPPLSPGTVHPETISRLKSYILKHSNIPSVGKEETGMDPKDKGKERPG